MKVSLAAQTVNKLPVMQETRVQSLGQKDSLEKGMATHSSILAWRIPWTEEPESLQSTGAQRVRHNWSKNTFTLLYIMHSKTIHYVVFTWFSTLHKWNYMYSFFIFIVYWSILDVVLVSDTQQNDLVIHIHISILFQILFPCRLLQRIICTLMQLFKIQHYVCEIHSCRWS